MKKILICGGAGFVGANLAIHFSADYEVTVLENLVRRGSELNLPDFKGHGINFVHGDIRNPEDIRGDYDVILECSAQPSATAGYANPMFDFHNNTVGLMNVLEHARKTKTAVIFWSTNKVYSGDRINAIPATKEPTRYSWTHRDIGINEGCDIDGGQHSIYGLTKAMSDLACQEYWDAFNVPTIVNRFSCLAGPRQWGKTEQGWVSWFVIANHLGFPVKICGWGGKQVRDVLFIDDVCRLIDTEIAVLLNQPERATEEVCGQVFNIGGGWANSISILEAFDRLGLNDSSEMEPERKGDHRIYITDYSKAKRVFGWEPRVGLDEGFAQIEKWVVDNKTVLEALYK